MAVPVSRSRTSLTRNEHSSVSTSRFAWVKSRPLPQYLAAVMMGLFVLVFSSLAIQRHNNFGTWGFDLGIYDQATWLLSRGESFITMRGMNTWGHHVNLVMFLYVPFYWLGAGARFLLVTQAIALSLSAIPAYRLGRKRFGTESAGLLSAAVALGYAPLQWIVWNNFHPEALAVTPVMFAWWFAEERKWKGFVISCLFALSTREEAAIVVTLLALRVLVREFRSRKSAESTPALAAPLSVAGFSAAWFLVCSKFVIPHFNNGAAPYYIKRFYGTWGESLPEVVLNVVRRPGRVLSTLFESSRRSFFGRQFFLLGALAAFSPLSLLIAAPSILSTGLAQESFIRDIRYQYTVFLVPVLIMSTIEGASLLMKKVPLLRKAVFALLLGTMAIGQLMYSPSPIGANSGVWSGNAEAATIREVSKLLPADASIAANDWIAPHFSHREFVFVFPNPVVPSTYGPDSQTQTDPNLAEWYLTFEKIPGKEGTAASKEYRIVRSLVEIGAVKIVVQKGNVLLVQRTRLITEKEAAVLRKKFRNVPTQTSN
jgi:uncharacterized membrane protein